MFEWLNKFDRLNLTRNVHNNFFLQENCEDSFYLQKSHLCFDKFRMTLWNSHEKHSLSNFTIPDSLKLSMISW